eukprot:scaffold7828_cov70-Phaeocystis_antarctica.AAC.7
MDLASASISALSAPPLPLFATPCAMLASSRARISVLVDIVQIVCCTSDSSAPAYSWNHCWPASLARWPSLFQQADRWMWLKPLPWVEHVWNSASTVQACLM